MILTDITLKLVVEINKENQALQIEVNLKQKIGELIENSSTQKVMVLLPDIQKSGKIYDTENRQNIGGTNLFAKVISYAWQTIC